MIDQLKRVLQVPDEPVDVDEVNASFFSPFKGMTEMYALQKGIEHGQGIENARTRPITDAMVAVCAAVDRMCKQADESRRMFEITGGASGVSLRVDYEETAQELAKLQAAIDEVGNG